ncbi:MAG: hypothetical protein GY874_00110 [Desulfobacteraceae bacterium]|nr:hypothetical protein [Desulfobacteraceae bacterium]
MTTELQPLTVPQNQNNTIIKIDSRDSALSKITAHDQTPSSKSGSGNYRLDDDISSSDEKKSMSQIIDLEPIYAKFHDDLTKDEFEEAGLLLEEYRKLKNQEKNPPDEVSPKHAHWDNPADYRSKCEKFIHTTDSRFLKLAALMSLGTAAVASAVSKNPDMVKFTGMTFQATACAHTGKEVVQTTRDKCKDQPIPKADTNSKMLNELYNKMGSNNNSLSHMSCEEVLKWAEEFIRGAVLVGNIGGNSNPSSTPKTNMAFLGTGFLSKSISAIEHFAKSFKNQPCAVEWVSNKLSNSDDNICAFDQRVFEQLAKFTDESKSLKKKDHIWGAGLNLSFSTAFAGGFIANLGVYMKSENPNDPAADRLIEIGSWILGVAALTGGAAGIYHNKMKAMEVQKKTDKITDITINELSETAKIEDDGNDVKQTKALQTILESDPEMALVWAVNVLRSNDSEKNNLKGAVKEFLRLFGGMSDTDFKLIENFQLQYPNPLGQRQASDSSTTPTQQERQTSDLMAVHLTALALGVS